MKTTGTAAALAVAATLGACGGADTSTPEGTAQAFLEAAAEGDAKTACPLVDDASSSSVSVYDRLSEGTRSQGEDCELTVSRLAPTRREYLGRAEIAGPPKREDDQFGGDTEVPVRLPAQGDSPAALEGTIELEGAGERWRISRFAVELCRVDQRCED